MKTICLSILFFLTATFSLEAVSIQLHNETQYPLKAVVLAADGSNLGVVAVAPQKKIRWNSSKEGNLPQRPSFSITPMTVQWFCPDDKVFCISDHVTPGSLVRTSQGIGEKVCNPKKEESP